LGFKVDDSGREQYNKGIDQTKQKQQSLTASFLKANLIMSAASKAVGAAFGFVRDSVIGATAETERYRVTLGTMMGDQEKANKIIHDLDYSPVSDFYGTANAIGGLQGMVTFGMQAEEASDILTRIGDIAQGNSEAFVSMSNNMGQVFAKGKADAIDLKQFVMQGFDVVGEVAKQSGKSREDIQKAGVTYEQTAAALKALTSEGGKYNGMLAKQMNTLGGVIKQFASFKAATAEAIGTGVSDELKEMLKYLLEIARAGQETFVGAFIKAIREVIHWIFQIMIMFEVLKYRIEDMGDALEPGKKFFLGLKDAAGNVLAGIMILAVELGKLIVAAFKPVEAFASPIIKELGAIAKDVFTAIANFIRPIVPMVSGSAGFFGIFGQAISGLLRPALKIALAIKGINVAIGAYKTAMGVAKTASFIFSGDLAKMAAGLTKLTGSGKFARGVADTFGLLTGKLSVMRKAAEGNRLAMMMLNIQMMKSRVEILAHAAATKIAAAAAKAWDWMKMAAGVVKSTAALIANKIATVAVTAAQKIAAAASKIWTAIQWALNAAMSANPIGLIIVAVVALIAIVVLLIKNWEKVGAFFVKLGHTIADAFMWVVGKIAGFFAWVGEKIKAIWNGIVGFFKKWGEVILQVLAVVILGIPGLIAVAVRQIIKHWDVIGPKVKAIWGKIKGFFIALGKQIANIFLALVEKIKQAFQWVVDRAIAIWETLKMWFGGLVEAIKGIWLSITGWFAGLWDGVVNNAMSVWDGLKMWFGGLVEAIKGIWNGIVGFFSGLWEALKEGPTAAIEYIKNAFFGLFNSIQEKLFGFINKVKEGWENVKGFFGGIADGVVNFFTGGNNGSGSIGGGGQMQPAYAGAYQSAVAGRVGPTSNYAYTSGGASTVNAQTSINVNVPPGTSQEQSEAIARQVKAQFDARLAGSINSSRANIPSPEARRH
jgi:phage-related protein